MHDSTSRPHSGPAGFTVEMIRPDLKGIPRADLPPGYAIRPMRPDEGPIWTDIQREAEPYLQITDHLFDEQFGHDPAGIAERCLLIISEAGEAVGTVSAWYTRDDGGRNDGRIHWLAVRPAYQGRGLGKAALAWALKRLAKWHARGHLVTQTRRLRAIRLYLDFGFVPDLGLPGAREAWQTVRAQLDHPALERCLGAE